MKNTTMIGGLVLLVVIVVAGYALYGNNTAVPQTTTYELTISNVSDTQPLSPGVFIVHTKDASLNFEGKLSPKEFEPLAEYGSNEALKTKLASMAGVVKVLPIDAPILPGESKTLSFEADSGLFLSGIQMAVGSNDGFALIDSVPLSGKGVVLDAQNYDNGTEENQPLGGGFAAGQPDPSRGADNIENGTPTNPQAVVSKHTQLTSPVMEISLTPKK